MFLLNGEGLNRGEGEAYMFKRGLRVLICPGTIEGDE